jgi:ribosome-associated translation inhibitor RaiA
METPLELYFQNLDPSPFVKGLIKGNVEKLDRIYDGITSCHVYVDAPHKHRRKGNRYEIRIELRVPGTELVVNNKPGDVHAHDDIRVAIRDAFNAMDRQLKKWKQKVRGEVKARSGPLQGRVAEIDHERGFGQIVAADGRLVYFHENSVLNADFKRLRLRDPVELVVQSKESNIGPQASTVKLISEALFEGQGGGGV